MNEWCIYIALYCVLLYTQSALQSCGGGVSPQPPPVYSIHLDDAMAHHTRSSHTSYSWRGERVIEPIKWMRIIRRPWLTRASGGNLARTVTPLLFTESQDLGLMSHPKDDACWLYSVPITILGALGPTRATGWAPPAGLTNTSKTCGQGLKLTFLLGSTGAPNFKKLGAPQMF